MAEPVPRPTSLAAFVYQSLVERIATGAAPAGERLVIDRIANQLRVSLIPVREALARLSAEGLVEYQLNRGYRVTAAPLARDYRELFMARLVVEFGAARQAVVPLPRETLQRLRALNEEIGQLKPGKTFKGYKRFIELNDRFHTELVGLAHNKTLSELHEKLAYGSRTARDLQGRGVPDLAENFREHESIVKALERQDVESAAAAVERHILAGMTRFLRDIERVRTRKS
ncbi:MAG: GntR family transcriptional regulator [Gammaproteobacteria bacterium]